MRVLAVRGENLASLAGFFEIDFDAQPIKDSGIFAVTGPTGAGKSTILDAICLALFDRLPRMDRADKRASIGRAGEDETQQLRYDDVRCILRHGTGSGYAEVDFAGQDGKRYRSRWAVRKSRGRANGNLQAQTITLTELDSGNLVGGTKTETLAGIVDRVGLSFQQFRRAVLLAQGDFDAFLRADAAERAELLEKITGTQIYSRISKAAHERASQEIRSLQELVTRLGENQPLSPEERAAAEAALELAKTESEAARADESDLLKTQEWYRDEDQLKERLVEAERLLSDSQAADSNAESDRHNLSRARATFAMRSELEADQKCRLRVSVARKALVEADERDQGAEKRRKAAMENSAAAKVFRDDERAAYDKIGPELDKAQRLDAVIASKELELVAGRQGLQRCVIERDSVKKALAVVEQALNTATQKRESNARWMEEHASAERLSIRLNDITTDLAQMTELQSRIVRIENQLKKAIDQQNAATTKRAKSELELAGFKRQEQDLLVQVESARSILDANDRIAFEAKRDALADTRAALSEARNALLRATKAQEANAAAVREKQEQKAVIESAKAVMERTDADLPLSEARLAEARSSLELSEAAGTEAAESFRLKLVDGKPCPVCGATEHPVQEVNSQLKARAELDRRRVAELERGVRSLMGDRASAEARIKAAEHVLPSIEKRESGSEADFEGAKANWSSSVATTRSGILRAGIEQEVSFSLDASVFSTPAALVEFTEKVDEKISQTARVLKMISEAAKLATKLLADREKLRTSIEQRSDLISQLKGDEQSSAQEAAALSISARESKQTCLNLISRLDDIVRDAFPDWKELAETSDFGKICHTLALEWDQRKEAAETALLNIGRLSGDLQASKATLVEKDSAVVEAEKRCAGIQDELGRLGSDRSGLLGGRPVSEVRTQHRLRFEAAEKAWQKAEALSTECVAAAATSAEALVAAKREAKTAVTDHHLAEQALSVRLQQSGISLAEAESFLAKGDAWLNEEQKRLDALRTAMVMAEATVAEREGALEALLSVGQPARSREEVLNAVETIRERLARASQELMKVGARVQQDNDARSRAASIREELEKRREKAQVWQQMDDLIGSADGAKFRRFAQSLTFDYLLDLSNVHLADLHRRYELQRAPGGDLALQVLDRDMADEIRGVHSLSGGERFLVSLALALGLASMSSNRGIKVESLFVDEGFGSLDSASLGMAISTLERLQATGRRIGVISHIEELKERIAVKIDITPIGKGRSEVKIITA